MARRELKRAKDMKYLVLPGEPNLAKKGHTKLRGRK